MAKDINDIEFDCPFQFSLFIERTLKNSKAVHGEKTATALEKFAMECFNAGFKAGKLPVNHHRFSDATK